MTRSKGIGSRGTALAAIVAALAAVDGCWFCVAAARDDAAREGSLPFARATCGFGLGPATTPAWSFFGVDPRTESSCESELFPLPGLACPDPTHGTGVSRIPSRK